MITVRQRLRSGAFGLALLLGVIGLVAGGVELAKLYWSIESIWEKGFILLCAWYLGAIFTQVGATMLDSSVSHRNRASGP